MEVVLGALPSLLPKLRELLADEYNLQKEVKGGIRFLQAELESMKAALEDISKIPPDQLPSGDKIWTRNVRELSYDIEDNIDTFMVQVKGHQPAKKHVFKKFIDKTLGSLMQPKIRRKIAVDIRDIKSRVVEVHDRRRRYEVNHSVDKSVKVDPLALVAMVRYKNPTELVGIEESRDEVIKILIEGNEVSKEQNKIVSVVGFGGLGKTTLANAVYEKLRAQFDCSAFVTVSQTPDMDRLFKEMFYQLANKDNTASANIIIDELRGFRRLSCTATAPPQSRRALPRPHRGAPRLHHGPVVGLPADAEGGATPAKSTVGRSHLKPIFRSSMGLGSARLPASGTASQLAQFTAGHRAGRTRRSPSPCKRER